MYYQTEGIILYYIDYKDALQIGRILTLEYGMQSFYFKKTITKKNNISKYPVLSIVELVYQRKEARTIGYITTIQRKAILDSLYYDPIKINLVFFISELLNRCVHEELIDKKLYRFVKESILQLADLEPPIANFHLWFLITFTRYLGFYPSQESYTTNAYFNLSEGIFQSNPQDYYLNEIDSALYYHFLTPVYEDCKSIKINQQQRQQLLQHILHYYDLHHYNCKNIKSISVLQEIFRVY